MFSYLSPQNAKLLKGSGEPLLPSIQPTRLGKSGSPKRLLSETVSCGSARPQWIPSDRHRRAKKLRECNKKHCEQWDNDPGCPPINIQGKRLLLHKKKHLISGTYIYIYLGVSKNMGKPPNHPFVHRVFPYFHHPFWGFSPYFGKQPYRLPISTGDRRISEPSTSSTPYPP